MQGRASARHGPEPLHRQEQTHSAENPLEKDKELQTTGDTTASGSMSLQRSLSSEEINNAKSDYGFNLRLKTMTVSNNKALLTSKHENVQLSGGAVAFIRPSSIPSIN